MWWGVRGLGVAGVGGDWAGDGRGGGFPDMKILTFALISKRLFLFYFLWKNVSITRQEYEPKNTTLSKKTPITNAEFDQKYPHFLKVEVGIFSDKKSFSQNG